MFPCCQIVKFSSKTLDQFLYSRKVYVSLGKRCPIIFSGKLHLYSGLVCFGFSTIFPTLAPFFISVAVKGTGSSVSAMALLQPACPLAHPDPQYYRWCLSSWIKKSYKKQHSVYLMLPILSCMLKISQILDSFCALLNSLPHSLLVSHDKWF